MMRLPLLSLLFTILSAEGFSYFIPQDASDRIETSLSRNENIKSLQKSIDALESDIKLQGLQANPSFTLGVTTYLLQPYVLNKEPMQGILLGASQSISFVTGIKSDIARYKRDIEVIKLKKVKQEYKTRIIKSAFINHTNLHHIRLLEDALQNVLVLVERYKSSSSFDALELSRLDILHNKLSLELNVARNALSLSSVNIGKISFGELDKLILQAQDVSVDFDGISKHLSSNYDLQTAILKSKIISLEGDVSSNLLPNIAIKANVLARPTRMDMATLSVSVPLPLYFRESTSYDISLSKYYSSMHSISDIRNEITNKANEMIISIKNAKDNLMLIDKMIDANNIAIEYYKSDLPSTRDAFFRFYNALNDNIEFSMMRVNTITSIHSNYLDLLNLLGDY